MKLITSILFVLFCASASGQTFAFQQVPAEPWSEKSVFPIDTHKKPQNNKVVTGCLIAVGGGLVTYWGAHIYASEVNQLTPNTSMEAAGLVVAGVGCGLIVTGVIIAVRGNHKHPRKHAGLQLITPKSNEIGLAYRF
jgi:hypothetical protein